MLGLFPIQNLDTPARILDGQALVLTPKDAVLHTMNDTGTFVWAHADGRRTVADISRELASVFEVDSHTAVQDVTVFVTTLVDKGLLTLSHTPSPVDLSSIHGRRAVP